MHCFDLFSFVGCGKGVLSAGRIVLIAFVAACVIAGGGILHLDVGNHPMSYYSVTGEFDYQQAFVSALIGACTSGPGYFSPASRCTGLDTYWYSGSNPC
jgi:hypothetical protein